MGGLQTILGESLERGAQKAVGAAESSSLGRGLLNLFGNKEWEFSLSPEGKAIGEMNAEFWRQHDQFVDVQTKKTLAAPAGSIPNPEKHAVNIQSKARLHALANSYGAKFENVIPLIARLRDSSDPRLVDHGQRLADIVSNEVRDTSTIRSSSGHYEPTSVLKTTANKEFAKANKVRKLADAKLIPSLNTEATYDPPVKGKIPGTNIEVSERASNRVLDTVMLPLLAVKHVGQFFNLPASSPLTDIGKALLRMDHANMEATVNASGILGSTLWREMYGDILAENGKIADWTGSPTLGKVLGRVIHQPGFNWMRKWQLNLTGAVGYHSAIDWAAEFARTGDKLSELRLREMHIDPAEVAKRGGKLTQEQLEKAVYHYTNNRMFFSKSVDQSLYQNRNIWTRSAFMYHAFVGSQVEFMRRELLLNLKSGNIKSLAQFAGTMAVLFPHVAPLIGGLETLLQTFSTKQAKDKVESGYSRLYHPKNVADWTDNYVSLMSHIGAAGVYFNYINAIKGHRFMSAIAGPRLGALSTDIEDLYNAATSHTKGATDPLKRDILRQGVPIIGGPLSHILVPTKSEKGFRSESGKYSGSKYRLGAGRLGRR